MSYPDQIRDRVVTCTPSCSARARIISVLAVLTMQTGCQSFRDMWSCGAPGDRKASAEPMASSASARGARIPIPPPMPEPEDLGFLENELPSVEGLTLIERSPNSRDPGGTCLVYERSVPKFIRSRLVLDGSGGIWVSDKSGWPESIVASKMRLVARIEPAIFATKKALYGPALAATAYRLPFGCDDCDTITIAVHPGDSKTPDVPLASRSSLDGIWRRESPEALALISWFIAVQHAIERMGVAVQQVGAPH